MVSVEGGCQREPVGIMAVNFLSFAAMACGRCLSTSFLRSASPRRRLTRNSLWSRLKHGLWRAREPRCFDHALRMSSGGVLVDDCYPLRIFLRHGCVRCG